MELKGCIHDDTQQPDAAHDRVEKLMGSVDVEDITVGQQQGEAHDLTDPWLFLSTPTLHSDAPGLAPPLHVEATKSTSAFTTMVRNFTISNGRPCPARFLRLA